MVSKLHLLGPNRIAHELDDIKHKFGRKRMVAFLSKTNLYHLKLKNP